MYKNWRELIKPKRLQVEADSLTDSYGKFYAEPFERGFGTTLGNAKRGEITLDELQDMMAGGQELATLGGEVTIED